MKLITNAILSVVISSVLAWPDNVYKENANAELDIKDALMRQADITS